MKLYQVKENILDLIYRELESELQLQEESDNKDIIKSLIVSYKYIISLQKGFNKMSSSLALQNLLKEYKEEK